MSSERSEGTAHPEPTGATIKELYAHAFRCAHPDCTQPLYKQDNDTGELILNSRIAHIHARRPGGPRWNEMSSAENRSAANLLLLCIPHSYEVDERPDAYPAETLLAWKQAQLDEYTEAQRSWNLDDVQVGRVLEASSNQPARVQADAIVEAARCVERFCAQAERGRAIPAAASAAWRRAWEAARTSFSGWDSDGNSVYAEPSYAETQTHVRALQAALAEAVEQLEPLSDDIRAEIAAIRVAAPAVGKWCDWVLRELERCLLASGSWPGPPPATDSEELSLALRDLRGAMSALGEAWRDRSTAPTPPDPPAEAADREPAEDPLRAHRELLDQARPWSRVAHRPYEPELRDRLAAAAIDAATLPPVMSTLALDLNATAGLAAAVARNATDDEILQLIAQDSERQPSCVAVLLLLATWRRCREDERNRLAEAAADAVRARFRAEDWSRSESWRGNECYGDQMFSFVAHLTSDEDVRNALTRALTENPGVMAQVLVSCSQWLESRDSQSWHFTGFKRDYRELRLWFPADAITAAGKEQLPNVVAATDEYDELADETEHLLSHVLRLRGLGSDASTIPAADV